MAGLIDGAQEAQPGAQDQRGGQPPAPQSDEQATAQEQEAFTRVETAAMEIVYGEQTNPKIAQQLQAGADNPAQVLGETAMMIFAQIDEQSGGKLPETVMLQGALKVLDLLAEFAQESGTLQIDESVQRQSVNYMLMSAAEMGYISENDIPDLQALIESMPEEELQGIVQAQTPPPPQQAGVPQDG